MASTDDGVFKGLRLHNTLTRRKEDFRPLDAHNVRMYVCGPTVYDYAHIGNARPIIVFDVLYRLLRHLYGADHVRYVRNITDVDDKINARAAEEGVDIADVTGRTIAQFHKDIAALGVLEPDVEPRATDHVGEMRAMIETLVADGFAYVAQDHVLFSPKAMNAADGVLPRYGQLANRSLDEMLAGARVDVAPYKRDAMDFVLWKPSKEGEPGWDSPCGIAVKGRPGWHIECSAMADKHLGTPFDIHAGGVDLVFPHHENEIAQSCCAFGIGAMAQVWMHNGFLQVEGEKMSKSAGNFVTINELLTTEKFGGRKWPGEVLRLAMLMTHYRQPIDWTVKRLVEAEKRLDRWADVLIKEYDKKNNIRKNGENTAIFQRLFNDKLDYDEEIISSLKDDINTPSAISMLKEHNGANYIASNAKIFGIDIISYSLGKHIEKTLHDFDDYIFIEGELIETISNVISSGLEENKTIEEIFVDEGIDINKKDDREFVFKALVNINIKMRNAARAARNWAEADRIRDELDAMGIQLKDAKDPQTGELVTTWEVKR